MGDQSDAAQITVGLHVVGGRLLVDRNDLLASALEIERRGGTLLDMIQVINGLQVGAVKQDIDLTRPNPPSPVTPHPRHSG